MNSFKITIDMITPGICGGAFPEKQAEIRVPSIRGQLRWWFRTLGGFASCKGISLPRQEAEIFGACAGEEGKASKLQVRIKMLNNPAFSIKDADELGAGLNTAKGYLLFPLRSKPKKGVYAGKSVFDRTLPAFELHLNWRGEPKLAEDIKALATVFGNLGSLGFRSRRAMGALAFAIGQEPPMPLKDALIKFANPSAIEIKSLQARNSDEAISTLANWLKGWRSHGRSPNLSNGPGFKYAEVDHDSGLGRGNLPAYRAAIGLPIIQFYSSLPEGSNIKNWDESWNPQKRKGEGRFASPVILRPYRDPMGQWRALVIFVESMKWPAEKPVYLNGQKRSVSLDLYEAMKKDETLSEFTL